MVRMEIGKVIFILILLAAFAFLTVYGIKGGWRKDTSDFVREGFESSGAPTRASECRCLPGYIPSNKMKNGKGGEIISVGGSKYWNPPGSNDVWYFSSCNQCNIMNVCDSQKTITKTQQDIREKYTIRGPMNEEQCKKWKDAINNGVTTNTYFCQKLTNPSDTQKCY